MSLRERILVILVIIFCGYAGLEYATYRWLMYPVFLQQEQQQVQLSVEHIADAVNDGFSNFQKRIASDAYSGLFYSVFDKNTPPQFENESGADFIALFDYQWNPVWTRLPEGMTLSGLEEAAFRSPSALLTKNQMGFSKKGLIRLNDQYVFIAAEPILSSPKSTAVQGMAFAGYYLTDKWLEELRNQRHLNFNWNFLSSNDLNGQNAEIARCISNSHPCHFMAIGKKLLQGSTVLFDWQNQPALLIKTYNDRNLSRQGMGTIYKLMLIKLGVGFLAVIFLTGLLQIVVINPILKLIRHIVKVGHPGSVKQKNIALSRKDEIGTLAAEFDQMCLRVQNAQIKLMEKSYLSGATEMSSGILHNVRNALSPITTRIDRIKDQFHEIPLKNLEQAQTELQNEHLSPQRRNDLMRFVELTFQNVITHLKDMVMGLEELSAQVAQIEDMLNTQRTFGSKQERPVEFIEPIQLLQNALAMVPEKFRKGNRIDVSHKIKKLPAIPVHPTTFIQILQNLLINASEAMEREKPLYPKITVDCEIEPRQPVDMLHWKIRDNGIGIAPDKIEAIFERGASSKNKGLTGIGLHWCANTVNAMQGRLWAESKGRHRGACFHLLIPMAAEECLTESQKG